MKLTHLRIARLGPFYFTHEMEIDPAVTILTGSNDTGKSSTLRLLRLFLENHNAEEMDINQDYLQESQSKWMEDRTPRVELQFQVESPEEAGGWESHYSSGDYAVIGKAMAVKDSTYEFEVENKRHGRQRNWQIKLPLVVFPSGAHAIREQIDLSALNPLEAALLQVGFGAPFSFDRLNALNSINYSRQLRDAEERINKEMARAMPIPSCLRFQFLPLEGNRKVIAVLLRDRHDAMTPFGLRGTGLRKMISLLAELLTTSSNAPHRILLLDEPENSLHPDAQHLLREFLFDLTAAKRTQVIYATHSPYMINPMRPEQVRLLRRSVVEGKPTSSNLRQATDSNFLALRTSLGISASDSLLFAPVTVVIEGDTEFKCLAPLIKKLADSKAKGFEDSSKLLSLSHFLDGMGDNYEYLCRLAKSQGTRVVLFLDGDKRKMVEQQKLAEKHPDVPIILLPNRDEFEQLVPIDIYFDALAEQLGQAGTGKELKEQWQTWLAADDKRSRMVFSKQVWHWLDDSFDGYTTRKPAVMRKAVELTNAEVINAEPLRELLTAIRNHLSNTSF
jgi:predicted ATP-dependent endonuclease of OLD family